MFSKMIPYSLTPELKDKGWKSCENAVFIPWPFSQENNQLYLRIEKKEDLNYF